MNFVAGPFILSLFVVIYILKNPVLLLLHRMSDIRSISKAIAAKDEIISITQSSRVESLRQALNWKSLLDYDSKKALDACGRIAVPCHLINPHLENVSHRVTLLKISLDKYYVDLENYLGNCDGVRSIESLAKVNHSICRVRLEANAICRILEKKRESIKAVKFHV